MQKRSSQKVKIVFLNFNSQTHAVAASGHAIAWLHAGSKMIKPRIHAAVAGGHVATGPPNWQWALGRKPHNCVSQHSGKSAGPEDPRICDQGPRSCVDASKSHLDLFSTPSLLLSSPSFFLPSPPSSIQGSSKLRNFLKTTLHTRSSIAF